MAYLTWLVRILLFLVLLGFAVRNLDVVHVHAFLGYEWQAPLVLVMLAALVLGVFVGAAGAMRTAWFLGSRNRQPAPENAAVPDLPMAPSAQTAGQVAALRTTRDLPDDEGA